MLHFSVTLTTPLPFHFPVLKVKEQQRFGKISVKLQINSNVFLVQHNKIQQ